MDCNLGFSRAAAPDGIHECGEIAANEIEKENVTMNKIKKLYAKLVRALADRIGEGDNSVIVADIMASIALLVLVMLAIYLLAMEGI